MISNHERENPELLEKRRLRRIAYSKRNAQPDPESVSLRICEAFTNLAEYRDARTVMMYLGCRSEVQTRSTVERALASDKRIVIPYCTVDEAGAPKLGLWWLESFAELRPGMWQILEPPKQRWGEAAKEVDPKALDLIMAPGVAFDARGGRLGNGRGYYDRLLGAIRPNCRVVGVGFESQIFDRIPMETYDVYLDGVITDANYYHGIGRFGSAETRNTSNV